MVTALIFAGGTGQRMNSRSKPKQFLELHGKSVILYTLEHFEEHQEVDNIIVVCVEDWIPNLEKMITLYGLKKIIKIVSGGDGGDKSIYNGLKALQDTCNDDDIVMIHDGVRPLIDSDLISANIEATKQHDAIITVAPATESVVKINENNEISEVPDRNEIFMAKAPQTFKYKLIYDLYTKAENDGFRAIDSSSLCKRYNQKMHTVISNSNNIKITVPSDYYIFKALFEAKENEQILGF